MAKNNKPLTEDGMIDILARFFNDRLKPEFDSLRDEANTNRKVILENRKNLNDFKQETNNNFRWLKDDIDGLKSEFSEFPSRKEINKLKAKVDRHHPSN